MLPTSSWLIVGSRGPVGCQHKNHEKNTSKFNGGMNLVPASNSSSRTVRDGGAKLGTRLRIRMWDSPIGIKIGVGFKGSGCGTPEPGLQDLRIFETTTMVSSTVLYAERQDNTSKRHCILCPVQQLTILPTSLLLQTDAR